MNRLLHRDEHDKVITELISVGFLSPKPRMAGLRTWSLLLPSIAQVVGLCCFGIVTWSFTEFSNLSPLYRINLVVFGSFAVALGGNVGSLPVTVEVFRKGLKAWSDWAALVFSGVASFVETLVALSFLGGFEIVESLPRIALLSILATLDTCLGMAQLGAYLASHDKRLTQWHRDYKKAVEQYYSLFAPEQTISPPSGYVYQAEDKMMFSDNSSGPCWCGKLLVNQQAYSAHVGHPKYAHDHETLYRPDGSKYASAVQARKAMLERYTDTLSDAKWDFPDLDCVREMRRRAARR